MNLNNQLPRNIYAIAADVVDVSATPARGKFFAITCTVAGSVLVKGGGVFIYVDVSDSTSVHTTFIDPATGVPFVNDAAMNTRGDGFYESIETTERTLVMIAGQTIYGRFDSLKSDGTFTGFTYAG